MRVYACQIQLTTKLKSHCFRIFKLILRLSCFDLQWIGGFIFNSTFRFVRANVNFKQFSFSKFTFTLNPPPTPQLPANSVDSSFVVPCFFRHLQCARDLEGLVRSHKFAYLYGFVVYFIFIYFSDHQTYIYLDVKCIAFLRGHSMLLIKYSKVMFVFLLQAWPIALTSSQYKNLIYKFIFPL